MEFIAMGMVMTGLCLRKMCCSCAVRFWERGMNMMGGEETGLMKGRDSGITICGYRPMNPISKIVICSPFAARERSIVLLLCYDSIVSP